MSNAKDIRVLIRTARRQGFEVEPTHGGHWKFRSPTGVLVFAASTPGDCRSFQNTLQQLKRAGYVR